MRGESTNAGGRAAVIRRELNNRAHLAVLPVHAALAALGHARSAAAALVFAVAVVARDSNRDRGVCRAELYRYQFRAVGRGQCGLRCLVAGSCLYCGRIDRPMVVSTDADSAGLLMQRLLRLANAVFGSQIAASVFEPLVADWQRELAAASSKCERARIVISGSAAFGVSLVSCLVTGGIVMPRAAIVRGLSVLVVSTRRAPRDPDRSQRGRAQQRRPVRDAILDGAADDPAAGDPAGDAADHDDDSRHRPGHHARRCGAHCHRRGAHLHHRGMVDAVDARRRARRAARRGSSDASRPSERAGHVYYPRTAARQARPTTPEQRAAARETLEEQSATSRVAGRGKRVRAGAAARS